MFYAAAPKNQYVPQDEARGSTPEADEKARFTRLEKGAADRSMAPSMHLIKCSTKKGQTDLTQTRVVHNFYKLPGSTAQDGWELKLWEKVMTVSEKEKGVDVNYTITFKRPYISHKEKLCLVTCEDRAWINTAGVAMWVELVVGSHVRKARGGRGLIFGTTAPAISSQLSRPSSRKTIWRSRAYPKT